MHHFTAQLEIIGVNPFVFVPKPILEQLFSVAGRNKGPIPVCGTVNGEKYQQTLVRFGGHWRLYINTTMLKKSPQRVGEMLEMSIAFDPVDRKLQPHPELVKALQANSEANEVFIQLAPSLQQQIIRYINQLKSPESVTRNVDRAIGFLLGKNRFVGREKP